MAEQPAASNVDDVISQAQNVNDVINASMQQFTQLNATLQMASNATTREPPQEQQANPRPAQQEEPLFLANATLIEDEDMIDFTKQIEANFDMDQIRQLFHPLPPQNPQPAHNHVHTNHENKHDDDDEDELEQQAERAAITNDTANNNEATFADECNARNPIDVDILQKNLAHFFGGNGLQTLFGVNADDDDDQPQDEEDEDSDVGISTIEQQIGHFLMQKANDRDDKETKLNNHQSQQHEVDGDDQKLNDTDEFEDDLSNFEDMKQLFMQNLGIKQNQQSQPDQEQKQDANVTEEEMNETEILEQMELMEKSVIKDIKLSKRNCSLNCQVINEHYLQCTQPPSAESKALYPLLLIHGFADSRQTWNRLLPKLVSYQQCIIAVSLRGFGDSQHFEMDKDTVFTIDEYTQDLLELLAVMNIAKAIWMGHGFGTFVCQKVAIENEEIVHKLVLISPHYTLCNEVGLKWRKHLNAKNMDAYIENVRREMNESLNDVKYAEQMMAECRKCNMKLLLELLQSMMDFDSLQYVKHISCPVYILSGEKDEVFAMEEAHKINKRIKSSVITCLPQMDHYLIWNKSAVSKMALIIWDFCRQ